MKEAQETFQLSERHVCRALGQPRSTQRYVGRKAGDEENLTLRVVQLASQQRSITTLGPTAPLAIVPQSHKHG